MSVALGLRVVRGPDWEWGQQDGGEGFLGTVVELEEGSGEVVVQWDVGQRHTYRCGYEGKYDLCVLDSAPAGIQHRGTVCCWCRCPLIAGTLWQCVHCFRYYLCTKCYHSGKHSLEHVFDRKDGTATQHVRLENRMLARRVMCQGIFPGAVVMRGEDWRWGDQDGGPGHKGNVAKIEGWEQDSFRSVAHVKWSHSQSLNIYCIGHKGMVDLHCAVPSPGGFYYPDHLAILGMVYSSLAVHGLRAGDGVRVELDPEVFMAAQEDHGGWEDYMAEYIGRDGILQGIFYSGDVVVRYRNGKILHLNRDCLTQLEESHGLQFEYGDVVRVCDDMAEVHRLQSGHGEWTDDMALALGQVGRVVKIRANGDIRVAVNGSRWVYNPRCLTPAPGETPIEERTGQLHVDLPVRVQCLSLSEAGCADVVVVAAAGGDLTTLSSYLQQHPEHVNTMYDGKAAIHMAVVENYLPIVRLLIQHKADLNIKDDGDNTALQIAAYLNSGDVAKLLLDGGADANIRDDSGVAPLATAAAMGHMEVVRVLLDHPRTNPNTQDYEGNSPLHRAVATHQLQPVIALLEAGADPTLLNHRLLNSLHRATGVGFLAGLEELMKWYPELINVAKKDGFTALHVAVVNGYTDIVSLLASHPSCDVNMKLPEGLTPLHLAVHKGYPVMVERLIGYGADLNATSSDGNTPLHLVLVCMCMETPSTLSPRILEIKRELDIMCGSDTLKPSVVVGVFMVREGASIHAANKMGLHPLSVHPPDVAQLVTSYAAINTKPPFHGKLREMESPFADISPRTPRKPVVYQEAPTASPTASPATSLSAKPEGKLTDSLPGKKSINQSVNVNTPTPTRVYDKDINPYSKLAVASALDSVGPAGGTDQLEPCSLCEDYPVSVMFQPCGHMILCHVCGSLAKRCLRKECRAEVKSVVVLCPMCLKNQPEETHGACTRAEKHRLCKGCVARSSSKCLLCSAVLSKPAE